ncbi:hypothetical protein EU513_03445 [Yimella sp. RIT 621]|uniref:hypothetical protein n=1 Tax=Yimella sp. RIT 621 TaxID=2510323 RepID=UPI0010D73AEE|nr:hypothetical protein [Yimella sp. RIT 621]RYG78131.1 hypothetical protein EU513_03445 [Yimella sp. RIT 621]
MVRRWQQLPLDRASALCPRVRASARALFDLSGPTDDFAELGPVATMDQLKVAAYDASASGHGDAAAQELLRLRHAIG